MHQVKIDLPWIINSSLYRLLCNLMKDYSSDILRLQFKYLHKVPRYCLPFAVLIGCEPYGLCLPGLFLQRRNHLFLFIGNNIVRSKPVFNIYSDIFFGKVTYMSETGDYLIIFTEKFFYCLCFCRRLYNYKISTHTHHLKYNPQNAAQSKAFMNLSSKLKPHILNIYLLFLTQRSFAT